MVNTPEQLWGYTMARFTYDDTTDCVTSVHDFSLNFTGTCIDCAAYLYAYLQKWLHVQPTAWFAMNLNLANITLHTWVTIPLANGQVCTMEVAWDKKSGMHVYPSAGDMLLDYVSTLYPGLMNGWIAVTYNPLSPALLVANEMEINEYVKRLLTNVNTTCMLTSSPTAYKLALRVAGVRE